MRTSYFSPLLALVFVTAATSAHPDGLPWLTDLPKAQLQAKSEKKSVLLFFHGSDWCPACVEMDRELFQSRDFIAYARQTLVLVDVDFPEKGKQPEALKHANLVLKSKFNIGDGFPTIVLLNEAGETVFQEAGYATGGAPAVLTNLQRHAQPVLSGAGGFKNLNVKEFARMTADKQNVILDVRTAKEFQSGHIADAINLDVTSSDFEKKAAALDRGKTYLVHCASGVRSVRACQKMEKLNFPRLYNLSGGFKAWEKAGQPVEK